MSAPLPEHTDVAVVGAGIVGLAHAYDAALRGLDVVVVDRDERATGASVRNFGHGVAGGLAGDPAHRFAVEARRRWLALRDAAGLDVREAGTLLVARHDDELAAIEAYAARWPELGEVVDATDHAHVDPGLGALHLPADLRIDAERAAGAIAAHLERAHGVRFAWGTALRGFEPGALHTSRGSVRADAIVIAPGADLLDLVDLDGLTRCRLQMLEVDPPAGRRYGPALMTGLSLLRYPGFAALAETAAVRERLADTRPELLEHGIHLIVTQRPDGALVIGDTHAYDRHVAPWRDERLDELLLTEACALLGVSRLSVRRRWLGVYPSAPGDPFYVHAPCDGVRIAGVVSGIGMTTALGFAPRVLDGLLQTGSGEDQLYAMPERGSTSTWSAIENASPR